MKQRKKTKSHAEAPALAPQQETAITLLASGRNVTDTAQAIGVGRSTVSIWLHHDPLFQAMLRQRRRELWETMVDVLRGLLPAALERLQQELQGENGLAAAVHILKAANLYGAVAPYGPEPFPDPSRGSAGPAGPDTPLLFAFRRLLEEDDDVSED